MTLILSGTNGLSDVDGSAATPAIRGTDTNTGMFFPAADTVGITTGGTERVRVDSSGNVGVGVTPTYKFDTSGTGVFGSAGGITLTTATNTVGIRGSSATTVGSAALHLGDNLNSSSRQWAVINGYTAQGALNFLVSSAVNTNPAVSGSVAMTLDASGNLLVGTTSSGSARLYVRGSGTTSSTASFEASNSSGATRLYVQDDGTTRFFGSSGSETARIDSSGNLLVGTTSANARLTVSGGGGYAASIENSTTNNNVLLVAGTASSNAQNYIVFAKAGTATGSINYNGTTVFYSTFSDYRLKNITSDLIGYKERVMSLQPKQGTWISNGSEFRGFLAHEFQNSYSSSVMGEKDAVDENGNPVMQAMQAGSAEVIADLVALLQEQQAIITQLQSDVQALKGNA